MDDSIKNLLNRKATQYGIDAGTLYAIVMHESGGNPNNRYVAKKEDSRGLFQVNIIGNMDDVLSGKLNPSKLFDPEYNADYQIPKLVPVFNKGKSLGLSGVDLAVYVEKNGERPAWNDTTAPKITKRIAEFYNEFTGGTLQATANLGNVIGGAASNATGLIDKLNPFDNIGKLISYEIFNVMIFVLALIFMYFAFVKNSTAERVAVDVTKNTIKSVKTVGAAAGKVAAAAAV